MPPESDNNLDVQNQRGSSHQMKIDGEVIVEDEMRSWIAVKDAAKRLIRASLREDNPAVNPAEEAAYPGFDGLVEDLSIVLGPSFDRVAIESMVREVRDGLRNATRMTTAVPDDTENATDAKESCTPASKSVGGECIVSQLGSSSTNSTESSHKQKREEKTYQDGDNDTYESRRFADRHASGLLETVRDRDCLEREFDVANDETFDIDEAIDVFVKCRILVLRNIFSRETTERVFPHYIRYIADVRSGKLSSEGTTTFGGDYFILKEDNSRFNYMATQKLVELSTGILDHEVLLGILSHHAVLGEDAIVNHVGTIDAQPGAEAQYWHADGEYLPNDDAGARGYNGVAGHDLPAFAVNMFTPLLPRRMGPEHGPTEFCVGTSHLRGHDTERDLPVRDPDLLATDDGIVEDLQEFEWHVERGHEADCPEHLHRIPLMREGDALLFDYMLTHRGGANRSQRSNRSMVFATYSRRWFRDTNFDTDFGHRPPPTTDLEELTRLTRYALIDGDYVDETE